MSGQTWQDAQSRPCAFSLGANVGDRAAALQGAVDLLATSPLVHEARVSSVYETDPVGGPEQPPYLNAVLVAASSATAIDLLGLAHAVENDFGRTRDVRWGPRTLDVDVLAVGAESSDDPVLTLPHPRAHLRAFVLVPWAEVDPDASIPGYGRVSALRDEAVAREPADSVRRVELVLRVPG